MKASAILIRLQLAVGAVFIVWGFVLGGRPGVNIAAIGGVLLVTAIVIGKRRDK